MENHFSKHFSDDTLIAHLDGELPVRQTARVRKHLLSCWRCRLRLSEMEEQVLEVTRAVQGDHFPGVGRVAEAKERFLSAAARAEVPSSREWSFGWLRWLGAAMAAGLAIAASGWLWRGSPVPVPKTAAERPRKIEARMTPAAPESPALVPVKPRGEVPSPTDLASLEIEIRYALHRAGACLGEPIEVERLTDGIIRVRGTAPSEARRLVWVSALSSVRQTPWLRVEVGSVEQWPPALDEAAGAPVPPAVTAPAEPPMQAVLETHFAGGGESSRRAAALSNDVVTHVETMLAHAWALRRLDRRYGATRAADIPAAASHLLHVMASEHLQGLRAETQCLLRTAGPALQMSAGEEAETVPAGQGEAPEDPRLGLFERSQRVHTLLMRLFTTAGAGQDASALSRAALPELRGLERAALDTGQVRIAEEVK